MNTPRGKKTNAKPGARHPKGLRMKQLMEATGLPKSTLLYYVEQGLLPEPVKTSPNMAYYSPDCVARAALIRNLQSQHLLPLNKIKVILAAHDRGEDLEPLLALSREIFGQAEGKPMGMKEFCKSSGLSAAEVKEMLANRMLLPLEPGFFDSQDLAMASLYTQGKSIGLKAEDVSYYLEWGQKIVDEEIRLRGRVTKNLPHEVNAAVTLQMVKAARATRSYIIDRLFQHKIASLKDLVDDGEAT